MFNKTKVDDFENQISLMQYNEMSLKPNYENTIEGKREEIEELYDSAIKFKSKQLNKKAEELLLETKSKYEDFEEDLVDDLADTTIVDEFKFDVLRELSILNCMKGNYKEAQKYYNIIQTLVANASENTFLKIKNYTFCNQAGDLEFHNKHYDKAIENFNLAFTKTDSLANKISISNKVATIQEILGDKAKEENNKPEEIKHYTEALKLRTSIVNLSSDMSDKTKSNAYLNLALAYENLNNFDEARESFKKSLKLNKENNQTKQCYLNLLRNRLNSFEVQDEKTYNKINKEIVDLMKENKTSQNNFKKY